MAHQREANQRERHTHEDRRAEILEAVRAICADEGMSRLSVSGITEHVGCTRSLFYHYFPTKEAALDAALEDAIDSFIKRLETWNAQRTRGDIDGALTSAAALLTSLTSERYSLSRSLECGTTAGMYTAFVHRVAERVARYICDSTVVDFARYHTIRIDHVYETMYVLITGLIMYLRAHPDAPTSTIKDIIASTLHLECFVKERSGETPS